MKFLRFFRLPAYLILTAAVLIALSSGSAALERNFNASFKCHQPSGIKISGNDDYKIPARKGYAPSIQSVNFVSFDSLANILSCSNILTNKPMYYEPQSNTLIFVKRGFFEPKTYPNYTGVDSKNSIMLRYSSDMGETWQPTKLIYDHRTKEFNEGRYPSASAFYFENECSFVYDASRVDENAGIWYGHFSGYASPTFDAINYGFQYFAPADKMYMWDIAGRVLGRSVGTDFYVFSVGNALTQENNLMDNSNLGFRKIIFGDEITTEEVIPPQWSSALFYGVDTNLSHSNTIVNLKYGLDGKMYMGIFGSFIDGDSTTWSPAVSFSENEGETWSDFDVMPDNVLRNYEASLGVALGRFYLTGGSKDFVPLNNGDFSFIMMGSEDDPGKDTTLWLHQIVEVYKESGTWGIRKVADYNGWITLYDENQTSRSTYGDLEMQLARTVDGSTLLVKWVDLVGDDQGNFLQTDIFVTARQIGTSLWHNSKNVTNSYELDRITMIADIIPNDLKHIPVIKLMPRLAAGGVDTNRASQYLSISEQITVAGYFDADDVLDVRETPSMESVRMDIFPNPASSYAHINAEIPENVYLSIDLYNVLGEPVRNIYSGNSETRNFNTDLKTSDLPVGTYYCTIKYKGGIISKIFNIIR